MGRPRAYPDWELPKQDNFIYALCDPNTKEIKYIGHTTIGLTRLRSHMRLRKDKRQHTAKKYEWIKSLIENGQHFDYMVVEYCNNSQDLDEAEIFWIEYFKMIGCNLFNIQKGGNITSEENRKIISKRTKEAMQRPEVIQKLKSHGLGKPSPMKGKHFDEEFRQKIHKSNMKRAISVIDNFGNEFESLLAASKFHNCTPTDVRRCFDNEKKLVHGKIFFRRKQCQL